MLVLIVNAFDKLSEKEKKKKRVDSISLFQRTVRASFKEVVKSSFPCSSIDAEGKDCNRYVSRDIDQLADLVDYIFLYVALMMLLIFILYKVFDWERENLSDSAKAKVREFDKIDIIFIAGDMKKVSQSICKTLYILAVIYDMLGAPVGPPGDAGAYSNAHGLDSWEAYFSSWIRSILSCLCYGNSRK